MSDEQLALFDPPVVPDPRTRGWYVLALDVCLDIRHPLRALIPSLDDAPDSDAVAYELLWHREVVENWLLAVSV